MIIGVSSNIVFQSTLSMRRATEPYDILAMSEAFQSTLSMRRATIYHAAGGEVIWISIHALHEESDRALSLLLHL